MRSTLRLRHTLVSAFMLLGVTLGGGAFLPTVAHAANSGEPPHAKRKPESPEAIDVIKGTVTNPHAGPLKQALAARGVKASPRSKNGASAN
ncbi:hypothetical protein [Acidovorax sp.]|uniref:hypothetical protein n=1 Tax=Acidovorax sp. TaxID=1872122 RepID=UPI00391A9BB1